MTIRDACKAAPMATADITVITVGREGASGGDVMAEIHRRLERQDAVRFQMHAMGTSLEGAVEDILRVAGELHAVPFELNAPRVYTVLKLDERRDKEQTLDDKVASVEALIERGLKAPGRPSGPAPARAQR